MKQKPMRIYLLCIFLLLAGLVFGQSDVTQKTITYFDNSRHRELVTELWIPDSSFGNKLPLVMFSHGTGGNRLACQWFCEGLAKKGFMVAAVDHYGNTYTNPIPKEFVTVWQRPQDISYVLTQILNDPILGSTVDKRKISAAGFSLGGFTALALAGAKVSWDEFIKYVHTPAGFKEVNIPEMPGLVALMEQDSIRQAFLQSPDLMDRRIKKIFVMAPAAGQGFTTKEQLNRVRIPVFVLGAEADSIAPTKTNADRYCDLLPPGKICLQVSKAGHYVFLNEGTEEMKIAAPVFFKDPDGVDRKEIHASAVDMASKFFKAW